MFTEEGTRAQLPVPCVLSFHHEVRRHKFQPAQLQQDSTELVLFRDQSLYCVDQNLAVLLSRFSPKALLNRWAENAVPRSDHCLSFHLECAEAVTGDQW